VFGVSAFHPIRIETEDDTIGAAIGSRFVFDKLSGPMHAEIPCNCPALIARRVAA